VLDVCADADADDCSFAQHDGHPSLLPRHTLQHVSKEVVDCDAMAAENAGQLQTHAHTLQKERERHSATVSETYCCGAVCVYPICCGSRGITYSPGTLGPRTAEHPSAHCSVSRCVSNLWPDILRQGIFLSAHFFIHDQRHLCTAMMFLIAYAVL